MVTHSETFRTFPDRHRDILKWKVGSNVVIAKRQRRPSCAAGGITAKGLLSWTQRAHEITRGAATIRPVRDAMRQNATRGISGRPGQESSPYFTAIDAAEVIS